METIVIIIKIAMFSDLTLHEVCIVTGSRTRTHEETMSDQVRGLRLSAAKKQED